MATAEGAAEEKKEEKEVAAAALSRQGQRKRVQRQARVEAEGQVTQALVDHYVGVGERLKVMVRAYQTRTGRLPTRQSDIGPDYARLCNEYNSLKRNHEGLAQCAVPDEVAQAMRIPPPHRRQGNHPHPHLPIARQYRGIAFPLAL